MLSRWADDGNVIDASRHLLVLLLLYKYRLGRPLTTRSLSGDPGLSLGSDHIHVRFWPKVGPISPKLDKSGTLLVQISEHFGAPPFSVVQPKRTEII